MKKKLDLSDFENKKIALVLSGGVVKAAAWHLGVTLALEELGFNFLTHGQERGKKKLEIGTYVGSSAGTLVNALLAFGHSPKDYIYAAFRKKSKPGHIKAVGYKDFIHFENPFSKNMFRDPGVSQDLPFVIRKLVSPLYNIPGFFSTQGLKQWLEREVLKTNSFTELDPDLFVVATQLDHTRKVIFSKYHYPNPSHDPTSEYYTQTSISDAMSASMSVPPFYKPYPIENTKTKETDYYIDGEIRETLSTHVAIDNGCEVIISSWTHSPYHFTPEIGSLANYGLPTICLQAIYLMIQKKIVASRARIMQASDIIETVNDFMVKENFTDRQRKKLMSILERKLHHKRNIQFVDIYPSHNDYDVFFSNHFSLNPRLLSKVVNHGYKTSNLIFDRS